MLLQQAATTLALANLHESKEKNVRRQTHKHTWPFVSNIDMLLANDVCVLFCSALWTLPQLKMVFHIFDYKYLVPGQIYIFFLVINFSSTAYKGQAVCPCVIVHESKLSVSSRFSPSRLLSSVCQMLDTISHMLSFECFSNLLIKVSSVHLN